MTMSRNIFHGQISASIKNLFYKELYDVLLIAVLYTIVFNAHTEEYIYNVRCGNCRKQNSKIKTANKSAQRSCKLS